TVGTSERSVLDQLAGIGQIPTERAPTLSPLERARSSLDGGDFVGAITIAEEAPENPALVAVAVRAAFELSDPELASRASALAEGVGEDSLPSTPGFVRNLRDVRQLAANRCSGWAAWLSRVASDVIWPDAADVARNLTGEWDEGELRSQSVADAAANDLLSAA